MCAFCIITVLPIDNINTRQVRDLDPSSDFSEEFAAICMVDQMEGEVLQAYTDFSIALLSLFKKQSVSVDDAIYVVAHRAKNESAITRDMREAKDIQAFLHACTQGHSVMV